MAKSLLLQTANSYKITRRKSTLPWAVNARASITIKITLLVNLIIYLFDNSSSNCALSLNLTVRLRLTGASRSHTY